MTAFPITAAAAGRFWVSCRDLHRAWQTGRAQQLVIRAIRLDRAVLTRSGAVYLTADELTWVAARAGVIDHEKISARPRPDELTAEGLLGLRAKLTAALAIRR